MSLECDWTVHETCKRLLSGVKKFCFGLKRPKDFCENKFEM